MSKFDDVNLEEDTFKFECRKTPSTVHRIKYYKKAIIIEFQKVSIVVGTEESVFVSIVLCE